MTFSGDKLEESSNWSKARSRTILGAIIFLFVVLLTDSVSRGYALVGLALLVTIMLHEAGHLIAAKCSKMKATEFFVGFGPRIWSFKKGETEYGIKAIPLGGYVKIIGMTNIEEVDEKDELRTYRRGHTYKKLAVILAGVTVNFILAYTLIFASLVGHGVPKDEANAKAVIESVSPSSAADKAGIKPDDEIVKINDVKINSFEELAELISSQKLGSQIKLSILRDGKIISREATLQAGQKIDGTPTKTPMLGVVRASDYQRLGVIEAGKESGSIMVNLTKASGSGVARLFSLSGLQRYSKTVVEGDYERQDRPQSIAGIVNIGGEIVNQDIWVLLSLIAVVNLFLGLFNLLPMLPLDGGHAAIAIYESIASRILKRKVQADFKKLVPVATVFVGLIILFSLTTLWLDILQIAS